MEKRQKLYIRELQILAQEKDLISVLLKLLSWLFKHIECGQTISKSNASKKVFQIQLISTHSERCSIDTTKLLLIIFICFNNHKVGRPPKQECQPKNARVSHGIPSNIKH